MRFSEEEYREFLKRTGKVSPPDTPKKSKYNAKKVRVDGILFDSQKEADYYSELKILLAGGAIDGFCRQARFVATQGDDTTRGTEYVADFVIFYPDKTYKIVDVKGMKTEVYKLKLKCLREKYPKIKVEEI